MVHVLETMYGTRTPVLRNLEGAFGALVAGFHATIKLKLA